MKKLIFIVSLLVSNLSYGESIPPLNQEISNKLILDLSQVELNEDLQDFVVVSFHICNDEIQITEINGSQKELIQKVKNKLSLLQIEEDYNEETLYSFKININKI